jgi:2-polyprenyl-6-methoxyphenol hydroxylase-like FAD-dependent oxidoreductase
MAWSNAMANPSTSAALAQMGMDPATYVRMMSGLMNPASMQNYMQFSDPSIAMKWMGAGLDPRMYTQMAGMAATYDALPEATLAWMSTTPSETSFSMAYMSDGQHIGMISWPQGSAGWRSCAKVGAEEALAPGLDAVKEMWTRLLPQSRLGVEALESIEQVRYGEPELLTTPEWWVPGLVLIGDSAHFFGPETGISSGIGLGDAHALSEALRQHPDDPDAVCISFVGWRAPVVRPYEAMDPGRQRMMMAGQSTPGPGEAWPPT